MNLNTANLKVAKAASKDDARRSLQSIHVTPNFTEATDGHILARVSLPRQYDVEDLPAVCKTDKAEKLKSFIIPASSVKQLKTFKKTGLPCLDDTLYIDVAETNQNGHAKFMATDREQTTNPSIMKIDGDYPDVDKVRLWPKGKPVFRISLNVNLLLSLLEIAKGCTTDRYEAITLYGYGKGRALYVKTRNPESNQIFKGLIMPLRDK